MPPSVSLSLVIHSWALEYRFRSASLKGESHGSKATTPEQLVSPGSLRRNSSAEREYLPVPSLGMSPAAPCVPLGSKEFDEFSTTPAMTDTTAEHVA